MNEKVKIGGIAFLILLAGSLGGMSLQDALQSDEPIYKCSDEFKFRNCPNGVKADGKRCYYNASNPYSYDYCSSNWTQVDKQAMYYKLYGQENTSNESEQKPVDAKKMGKRVVCTESGCSPQ